MIKFLGQAGRQAEGQTDTSKYREAPPPKIQARKSQANVNFYKGVSWPDFRTRLSRGITQAEGFCCSIGHSGMSHQKAN